MKQHICSGLLNPPLGDLGVARGRWEDSVRGGERGCLNDQTSRSIGKREKEQGREGQLTKRFCIVERGIARMSRWADRRVRSACNVFIIYRAKEKLKKRDQRCSYSLEDCR